jgi:hypothetical protein
MGNSPHRSFEQITCEDLARLAELALADFAALFKAQPYSAAYNGRMRLLCLCQGAARHFLYGDRGVNDFDVWGFFEGIPDHPFPYRRRGEQDFGPSKFGRNPDDGEAFIGRRVDVIGRSIPMPCEETPAESVQRYLRNERTNSARRLAERPVVVLWPTKQLREVIWKGPNVPP